MSGDLFSNHDAEDRELEQAGFERVVAWQRWRRKGTPDIYSRDQALAVLRRERERKRAEAQAPAPPDKNDPPAEG